MNRSELNDVMMGTAIALPISLLLPSYQINPLSNIRYFLNWTEHVSVSDGDHKLEYSYQF